MWYYGNSGKDYYLDIPLALHDVLLGFVGKADGIWCDEHGPEAKGDGTYYFACSMPAGHGGKFHLALGGNHACAIWPVTP